MGEGRREVITMARLGGSFLRSVLIVRDDLLFTFSEYRTRLKRTSVPNIIMEVKPRRNTDRVVTKRPRSSPKLPRQWDFPPPFYDENTSAK
jgi:hypothetical protein